MKKEAVIKLVDVKKKYRLGAIGGGTLRGDLQSWYARVRKKDDPNTKLGQDIYNKNETFYALKGISFEAYKGERLGIIGGNGAGKSTALKLLSRVTAPTEGEIYIQGRISSMLEVGTGFHPELTGRENIYLNGAILGMSRAEIAGKIENIIDFSECRQFIDTPVKRYSSGMYVKLAFSVAAHLDSEILVMDEVLAVGDMKFQEKCLGKMRDVADKEGKTVLYVSHNMNTIRQLCERCIVLQKGEVVFDGDTEEAIKIYLGNKLNSENNISLKNVLRDPEFKNENVNVSTLMIENENLNIFNVGSHLAGTIVYDSKNNYENVFIRMIVKHINGTPVTMINLTKGFRIRKGIEKSLKFKMSISGIAPGQYTLSYVIYRVNTYGMNEYLDGMKEIYNFHIEPNVGFNNNMEWKVNYWGYLYGNSIEIMG